MPVKFFSRPLLVYTRCPRTDIKPLTDSSPMAPFFTTSILLSPTNLLIAIRKGTRSSRNPHPIYNFLTYHRLSSSYSAFVPFSPSPIHTSQGEEDDLLMYTIVSPEPAHVLALVKPLITQVYSRRQNPLASSPTLPCFII